MSENDYESRPGRGSERHGFTPCEAPLWVALIDGSGCNPVPIAGRVVGWNDCGNETDMWSRTMVVMVHRRGLGWPTAWGGKGVVTVDAGWPMLFCSGPTEAFETAKRLAAESEAAFLASIEARNESEVRAGRLRRVDPA